MVIVGISIRRAQGSNVQTFCLSIPIFFLFLDEVGRIMKAVNDNSEDDKQDQVLLHVYIFQELEQYQIDSACMMLA